MNKLFKVVVLLVLLPFSTKNQIRYHFDNVLVKPKETFEVRTVNNTFKPNKNIKANVEHFWYKYYREINETSEKYNIPPLFLVALISLETNYGRSELFLKHGNAGSIKRWKKDQLVVYYEDDTPKDPFVKYKTRRDGILAVGEFLTKNPRYSNMLKAKTTYDKFYELHKAGYATDPNHPRALALIYKNSLQLYGINEY